MPKQAGPKHTNLTVLPPTGGIVRKFGFQQQPPFTCIDSTNVWPFSPQDGRSVSSARCPLAAFTSPATGGNMAVAVNGDGTFTPTSTYLVAAAGVLYRYNGVGYDTVDSGLSPPAVTTGRPVYAAAMQLQVFIANDGIPLVYNHAGQGPAPASRLTALTATVGTVPVGNPCVEVFQGSVWFGGAKANGHILYGSRSGGGTDWNYAALPDDEGGAFSTAGAEEGRIGERITALCLHTSDAMIVGCLNSVYALHGHPRRGGTLEVVSPTLGIMGQGACCVTADGRCFAMTKLGLVTIDSEHNTIAPISRQVIPDDLVGLPFDPDNHSVSMAYNSRWNAIHIVVRDSRNPQAWLYYLDNGSFHRDVYSAYPTVLLNFPGLDSATTSGVLFIGSGYGGVARFDADGDESFTYQFYAGPIKIAPNATYESICLSVKFIFGMPTAPTGYITIWFGQDGEECYRNALNNRGAHKFTRTFASLVNNGAWVRPLMTGAAMIVEVGGTDGPMTYEGADCELAASGRSLGLRNWVLPPVVDAGSDLVVEFK